MKSLLFVILTVFIVIFPVYHVFGISESKYNLGTINDLIIDGANYYYFEAEKDIKSTTWIPDTRIKIGDGKTSQNLSEKLFTYPTELNQNKDYLYFAVLSEKCKDQILCDYQDLLKMSKKDGSVITLTKDLKSSVHISLENDELYISESSGNIWKVDQHDGSKNLVTQANEIIMDISSEGNNIYWIEELADQNSSILSMEKGSNPKIIAKNLQIPYDLTVQNGKLYWNEIQVKAVDGSFAEVTAIKSYDGQISTLMEFQNTSPVAILVKEKHYNPYLVFDDYLFLVNNTSDDSVIHMINIYNSTKYDIGVISNYDSKYLRTDGSSLFIVGKNKDGFVIETHPLPIKVPEFPAALLVALPLAFSLPVILQRFWRS